jgi:hypothetical protein
MRLFQKCPCNCWSIDVSKLGGLWTHALSSLLAQFRNAPSHQYLSSISWGHGPRKRLRLGHRALSKKVSLGQGRCFPRGNSGRNM